METIFTSTKQLNYHVYGMISRRLKLYTACIAIPIRFRNVCTLAVLFIYLSNYGPDVQLPENQNSTQCLDVLYDTKPTYIYSNSSNSLASALLFCSVIGEIQINAYASVWEASWSPAVEYER